MYKYSGWRWDRDALALKVLNVSIVSKNIWAGLDYLFHLSEYQKEARLHRLWSSAYIIRICIVNIVKNNLKYRSLM